MTKLKRPGRRKLPRSFKELTPANHFKPSTFFRELVLKAWMTPRRGEHRSPVFPKLREGQVAITWIGHASFLIQFTDLNVLIDPNFANWLFFLKRIKRTGLNSGICLRLTSCCSRTRTSTIFTSPLCETCPTPKWASCREASPTWLITLAFRA